jgi:hypothetical protein
VRGRTSARRGALVTAGGAVAALCVFAVVTLLHAPAAPVSGLDKQLAAAQLAAKQPAAVEPAPNASPSPSASPSPTGPPPGDQISALGDSVMLAASPALRHRLPGIRIDAKVSRAMQKGPGIISGWAHHGSLRPVVLLGLGTNGPFPADMLEGIIHQLGPDRTLYLVNVYLPTRPWGGEVNHTLTKVASAHTNVHLIDWRSAAGAHQNLLWPDRIHPRPGAGADLYARTVVEAMSTPMRAAPPGRVQ